jgi:hypothetical protein
MNPGAQGGIECPQGPVVEEAEKITEQADVQLGTFREGKLLFEAVPKLFFRKLVLLVPQERFIVQVQEVQAATEPGKKLDCFGQSRADFQHGEPVFRFKTPEQPGQKFALVPGGDGTGTA